MKQVVVISGKGGTGKTTVAAALAPPAAQELNLVLTDADVDASNLELLLSPREVERHTFTSAQVGVIDPDRCSTCGACREACRYDAVRSDPVPGRGEVFRIDTMACEGCAACSWSCPCGAIQMVPEPSGLWFLSDTRFGPLYHAHLYAGRENSGKLVSMIKRKARDRATALGDALLLVDGPPGIGCPAISALSGADLALVVTEPTVSGEHDLERIVGLAGHFGIPPAVVVNKADLNPERTGAIVRYCRERGIAMLGQVPYDPSATRSMIRGAPLTEQGDGVLSACLHEIWNRTRDLLLPRGALPVLG
jgi:MinD superfamily P-loop ATPase